MANVKLINVSKRFGQGLVVKNIDLEVYDKEFCVLVGPSGCGKTTTLRMIAGLEELSEGEIYIDNKCINDIPPKDRDIAMVFQSYALYPHMNVFENMAFGLRLRRYPRKEIEKRVKEAAEILDIEQLLDRKPKELSGGQKQRVALGRAIVRKPKVFLFDEPLSNLDAKLRVLMRSELKKLHDRLQATIIYVTHDQVEAMTLGDKIVVMNKGIIQQIGEPLEIYDKPKNKFVAGFIGSPPMNFINVRVTKKDSKLYLEEGTFSIPIVGNMSLRCEFYLDKTVVLGIRPEDIHDQANLIAEIKGFYLKAKVDVIEFLGNTKVLHLTTGKSNFTSAVDSHNKALVNEEIEVTFNLEKIHLFDKDTEEAIV